jgi:hypothetical protein
MALGQDIREGDGAMERHAHVEFAFERFIRKFKVPGAPPRFLVWKIMKQEY